MRFITSQLKIRSILSLILLLQLSILSSATINLRDADIRAFASDIAKITNKTIVLDPRIKGMVTVVSNQDLNNQEAYAVFLSVLKVHGYSAIENSGVVKVMPESSGRQDFSSGRPDLDSLTTEVIRLKQANAKNLTPLLKPLINKQGHIAAYEATNSLIIADYVGNLIRIKNLLKELDKSPADFFELIPLKNTSANEISRILNSMYQGSNSSSLNSYSVIAVDGSNSLLLRGQKALVNQLKDVIKDLDKSDFESSNLKVVYLKYAQAEEVASILKDVAKNLEGQKESSGELKGFNASISFHLDTNSLVISAQPEILKTLESIISQLDIRRAQVLVEALIIEVSDKLAQDLGVQLLYSGDGKNSPALAQRFGSPNPDLIAITGSQINDDNISSNLSSTASNSLLGLEGMAAGIARVKNDSESFAAILNIVTNDADSNVLSTPSIMTMDNEQASIIVGQEIPITTGETLSTNNSNPFRTVQRQEVGVKLTVTPQINEGNAVKLLINQEVSSVVGPITATTTDLITSKRQIQTTVLVEDGDTIVLGGLIDDDVQESEKKVPILGDIPLIGRLFKSSSTSRSKRNLIVFMRPKIIRDTASLRAVSSRKYNYFQAIQNSLKKQGRITPELSIMQEVIESKDPSN
ncbi:MAG: type II secretion system secretin GspD [SAR86 cluster bacterium]|jgi:general secretion pathway protein D|nr:type II secretion system secretin GspD [SAR86 cluster bacterium]